jgi:hypothetical protein
MVMEIHLNLDVLGARKYEKVSYPARYGRLVEITTPAHCFQFNLNGEIRYLQGIGRDWPHPSEWLKRTSGNQWVYYDSGGYNRIYDYLGEYYLPSFTYPSNSLWETDPFKETAVQEALSAFKKLPREIKKILGKNSWSAMERGFLLKAMAMDTRALEARAGHLHTLIGDRINVLPPDTRHVDYDCIPLIIADGCLYHCSFCRVKSNQAYRSRSQTDIMHQLTQIREFYGPDLGNYNSLFLGQHDALNCGAETIICAAQQAYTLLDFEGSYLEGCFLFLFGSVDSFLNAAESLFEALNGLPYRTYLNLGLESADQECLDFLGKPLKAPKVEEAFRRMTEINGRYDRIEVTANFVVDMKLPSGHWAALSRLTRDYFRRYSDKGAIYLSPLSRDHRKALLQKFKELKMKSRRPLYLYLIQRL